MKKAVTGWQIAGFVFTGVAGTLLHFLFDWTDGNIVVALFSAVNESIWEHLKLLFYPMAFFALVEYYCWGRETHNFWCVKAMGILFGLIFIPVVYYTYTGILGINADWFNVTIFFLAAAMVFWLETKLFQSNFAGRTGEWAGIVLLCVFVILFTVFTFVPPHIPFFQDPITGAYGL